jgi:hypothetical protein
MSEDLLAALKGLVEKLSNQQDASLAQQAADRAQQEANEATQRLLIDSIRNATTASSDSNKALANALISRPEKIDKPDKPAKYDGKDRSRLREFRTACRLYFDRLPREFTTAREKVLFVGARLEGKPADWFLRKFTTGDNPSWIDNYDDFLADLTLHFGITNELAYAERQIAKLSMTDKTHFDTHLTLFEEWKDTIGDNWSKHNYWKVLLNSLSPRIRAFLLSRDSGAPTTYDELVRIVTAHDTGYWTLHNTLTPVETTPAVKTEPRTPRIPTTPSSSTAPKPSAALASILGPDGKLLQAEKDRRMKFGLCLACGEKNHMANQCPNVKKNSGGPATTPGSTTTATTNKSNNAPPATTSKARATYTITPDGTIESEIMEVEDSDSEQSEN